MPVLVALHEGGDIERPDALLFDPHQILRSTKGVLEPWRSSVVPPQPHGRRVGSWPAATSAPSRAARLRSCLPRCERRRSPSDRFVAKGRGEAIAAQGSVDRARATLLIDSQKLPYPPPATRSPRAIPVAATITCVSRNLVPASPLICTEVSADRETCGLTAEWVALEGPVYAMVASPRCIAHAVAASQDGYRIRPITPAERATGELAI